MNKALFSALFLVFGFAAPDARAAGASIPDFSWTRCYGGLNAGYASSRLKTQIPWSKPAPLFLLSGAMHAAPRAAGAGVQTGCNIQWTPSLVVGLEGQISVPGLVEKQAYAAAPSPPQAIYKRTDNLQFDLAARAGFAFNRSLVFAKAGVAFANFEYAASAPTRHGGCGAGPCPPVNSWRAPSEMFRPGLLLGGGLEYALTHSWTVKAEYNRIWLGRRFASAAAAPASRFRMHESRDVVRVGFNFLFDGPAPWAARD